ncbi:MAG: sigma factor, partial [Planctomycetota bacterium]
MSTDIEALQCQQEEAWNRLAEAFHDQLLAKARWLLHDASIKRRIGPGDLVNIALARAWQKIASFRGHTTSQLAAWMLQILHNAFVDECRPKTLDYVSGTWSAYVGDDGNPQERMLAVEEESVLFG